jgi:hypothetical protein
VQIIRGASLRTGAVTEQTGGQLKIITAINSFDRGRRIRRKSWPHGGQLGFQLGNEMQFIGGWPSGAYMHMPSGNCEIYNFTLDDIRADDWEIIK